MFIISNCAYCYLASNSDVADVYAIIINYYY